MRRMIGSAVATGGFCAVFALGVEFVTDALTPAQVVAAAATSGFLGSLFAQNLIGHGDK